MLVPTLGPAKRAATIRYRGLEQLRKDMEAREEDHFFFLERGCSTARHYAPIDDHAPSAGCFLDGDQPEAFREPDGGTGLSPADVGAFRDLCDW